MADEKHVTEKGSEFPSKFGFWIITGLLVFFGNLLAIPAADLIERLFFPDYHLEKQARRQLETLTPFLQALGEDDAKRQYRVAKAMVDFAIVTNLVREPLRTDIQKTLAADLDKSATAASQTVSASPSPPTLPPQQSTLPAADRKLLPRVYIQIAKEGQRASAEQVQGALKEAAFIAPGIELPSKASFPSQPEIRFFSNTEEELKDAKEVVELVKKAGLKDVRQTPRLIHLPGVLVRPRHYELWFANE